MKILSKNRLLTAANFPREVRDLTKDYNWFYFKFILKRRNIDLNKAVFKPISKADVKKLDWSDNNTMVLAVSTKSYEKDHYYFGFLMYVENGYTKFLELGGTLGRNTKESVLRKCDKFWIITNPSEDTSKNLQDKLDSREQNTKYVRLRTKEQDRDKSGYEPNDYSNNARFAQLKLPKARANAKALMNGLKNFLQTEVYDYICTNRKSYGFELENVENALKSFEDATRESLPDVAKIAAGNVNDIGGNYASYKIIKIAELDVDKALKALKL